MAFLILISRVLLLLIVLAEQALRCTYSLGRSIAFFFFSPFLARTQDECTNGRSSLSLFLLVLFLKWNTLNLYKHHRMKFKNLHMKSHMGWISVFPLRSFTHILVSNHIAICKSTVPCPDFFRFDNLLIEEWKKNRVWYQCCLPSASKSMDLNSPVGTPLKW